MRWMTYDCPRTGPRTGLLSGDGLHLLPGTTTLLDLLGDDGERLSAAAEQALTDPADIVTPDPARTGPPLRPPSIRESVGFLDHVRNTSPTRALDPRFTEFPPFYFSNPAAVTGPYTDIPLFPGTARFDYELEVGAVIGLPARDVKPEHAHRHIAGYVLFCDWSARDLQLHEMGLGLGPAKGKDGANTLGPYLVTPDVLAHHRANGTHDTYDTYDLEMTAEVNGVRTSSGRLSAMDWTFADMIAYMSRGTTLRPGELIGSGTVPSGCLLEAFVQRPAAFRGWLQPGDVVRLEVQELGHTLQTVLPGPAPHPLRPLTPEHRR
ncbi:fumarylacetoacetate hydrolase family protein [Streptomyces sp. NPDC048290]|uniref:fumarylacetoacetate hydrolase family protein n=1 Tax=Streptomyces sp. NPDC048290 TaxID=3155811 RepID=UPI00342CD026